MLAGKSNGKHSSITMSCLLATVPSESWPLYPDTLWKSCISRTASVVLMLRGPENDDPWNKDWGFMGRRSDMFCSLFELFWNYQLLVEFTWYKSMEFQVMLILLQFLIFSKLDIKKIYSCCRFELGELFIASVLWVSYFIYVFQACLLVLYNHWTIYNWHWGVTLAGFDHRDKSAIHQAFLLGVWWMAQLLKSQSNKACTILKFSCRFITFRMCSMLFQVYVHIYKINWYNVQKKVCDSAQMQKPEQQWLCP